MTHEEIQAKKNTEQCEHTEIQLAAVAVAGTVVAGVAVAATALVEVAALIVFILYGGDPGLVRQPHIPV